MPKAPEAPPAWNEWGMQGHVLSGSRVFSLGLRKQLSWLAIVRIQNKEVLTRGPSALIGVCWPATL